MEKNDYELVEPYNPTDPIVKMDPEMDQYHIALPYQSTESTEEKGPGDNAPGAQTRYDAIVVPLVQINQTKLNDDQIETVEIYVSGFLPELYLKFYDTNDAFAKLNAPGMTSTVTVIMAAPIEGVSKKVSLNFYIIESSTNTDGSIEITGELNIPAINQVKNEQIGSDKMTTYDFLKQIAQDTKLGFAATEKCEDINDARWRQVYSQTFKDYIEDQLSFAGLDDDSVFDAWVDQFGYLVMVNISYVMGEEIDPAQLTMRVVKGHLFNEKKDVIDEQQYEEVIRLITNSQNLPTEVNNAFTKWSNELDNDVIKNEGTVNKYYYMTGIGDTNTIASQDLEIIEPSADGQNNKDTYKFDKCEFIGFEMDDEQPVLVQKRIVSRFKSMMKYKQIFVEMPKPNYYLQRGTLINVDFEDYDMATKKATIVNNGNMNTTEKTEDILGQIPDVGEDNMKNISLGKKKALIGYVTE